MLPRWKIISLFFVIISLFFSVPVLASPPPPSPICQVNGTIKSVTFKEAYDEACLSKPHGCPTDIEVNHPSRYYLNIKIASVTHLKGNTTFNTCENLYPVGNIVSIFINQDKVKNGDSFSINQEIQGEVQSFWGSSFDSYELKSSKSKFFEFFSHWWTAFIGLLT